MGKLKCGISQKRLIIEQNGRKFGTRGTTVHMCSVPLMPDSLSLVWGHSVHLQHSDVKIFKRQLLPQFSININHILL